jgi:hypothetical protein
VHSVTAATPDASTTHAPLPTKRRLPLAAAAGGAGGGGGGSDFFFNPFAAKRAAKTGSQRATWVAGEVGYVKVHLSNPTPIPLYLQRVQLVTATAATTAATTAAGAGGGGGAAPTVGGGGGAEAAAAPVECFPTSLTLPPFTAYKEVTLTAKALAAGTVAVTGVCIRCFNMTWTHGIDSETGLATAPCPFPTDGVATLVSPDKVLLLLPWPPCCSNSRFASSVSQGEVGSSRHLAM